MKIEEILNKQISKQTPSLTYQLTFERIKRKFQINDTFTYFILQTRQLTLLEQSIVLKNLVSNIKIHLFWWFQ